MPINTSEHDSAWPVYRLAGLTDPLSGRTQPTCKYCGGRRFRAQSLEIVDYPELPVPDPGPEHDDDSMDEIGEYTGDGWVLQLWCLNCDRLVIDRRAEIRAWLEILLHQGVDLDHQLLGVGNAMHALTCPTGEGRGPGAEALQAAAEAHEEMEAFVRELTAEHAQLVREFRESEEE